MDGGTSKKRQAGAQPEGQSSAKRRSITMGLDTLDCPVCSKPLRPPIFQYLKGDFICSDCRAELPKSQRSTPKRCYGMERIVNSIFVPCKHRCGKKMISYKMAEHEKKCFFGPCFCPVSGCGFTGKTRPLLDHLTSLHKLPTKTFKYFVPFELPVQAGSVVLRGGYGRLLLLEVASLESLGHSVSLVCARNASIGMFRCSVGFSCFEGHYQLSLLEVQNSLPPNGLPRQYSCVVPKVSDEQTEVMLHITINFLYDHKEELEEEDNSHDHDFNKDEEDNMTTNWRMVIAEMVVKQYFDDNSCEEEDDDMITTARTRWMMATIEEKEDEKDDAAEDDNGD